MRNPWLKRASILIRVSAGMMLIFSMTAFAMATVVGGMGCAMQVAVGVSGIIYSYYLRNVSENIALSHSGRAYIASVINTLGLPMILAAFVPLPSGARPVVIIAYMGMGILSVLSLFKAGRVKQ